MSDEAWRQWQQLAALWAPSAAAAGAASSTPAGGAFAPYALMAENFKVATERFISSIGADPAQSSPAALVFGEFLREQFGMPFSSPPGFAPAAMPPLFASPDWQALGPSRAHQQRWQRMHEAAARVAQAQARLQSLWSDSMKQAAGAFVAELTQRSASAPTSPDWREVYDQWIERAEQRYAQLAREPGFCEAQTEMVNAGNLWRHEARISVEQWCKWLDLPTRSEINSLAQKLKLMEQTLRAAGATAEPRSEPE